PSLSPRVRDRHHCRGFSSQRLCRSARSESGAASDDSPREPAARCDEAVRLCGNERAAARAPHGYKAAWVVEKYGVRLMPELYAHLNPMPYEAALQMELELAEDLRNEGYTVTGGH